MKHQGYNGNVSSLGNSTAKKWKFQGVELEEALGLDLYEMEFRSYDPSIGRFTTIDPIGEERNWLTPYNFVQNNPISRVDPSGLLDTYGLDGNGDVRWLDDKKYYETDANGKKVEVDRLYAIDDKDNIVKSKSDQEYASATVDKSTGGSFLKDLASNNTGTDYTTTQNMGEAFGVFKFAADNSNVEWGLQSYKLDNGANSYVLLTAGSESNAGNGYNLGLKGGYEVENLIFDLHSHPNTKGGSGYKSTGFPFVGDKNRQYNHKTELDGKGLPLPLYYIYHKPSSNLYRYTPSYGDKFIKKINKSSDFYTGKYE